MECCGESYMGAELRKDDVYDQSLHKVTEIKNMELHRLMNLTENPVS